MPRDSNGIYTLDPGYLAVSGATIQPSQHNPALEDIAMLTDSPITGSDIRKIVNDALTPPPSSQQAQHALDWIGDASGSDEPTPTQEESLNAMCLHHPGQSADLCSQCYPR